MKILYILQLYPVLSQTYIRSEINALKSRHTIKIISLNTPKLIDLEYEPFEVISDEGDLLSFINSYKPDVLHSHFLINAELLYKLSINTNIPFTIRAHSFDVLQNTQFKNEIHQYINNDFCKGILSFPFTRELLKKAQVDERKIIDALPVIDVQKFNNKKPNGNAIMNVGAYFPKKKMEDFLHLSTLLPHKTFNLYALGSNVKELAFKALVMKAKVNFIAPTSYSKMPLEYKKHSWLIYTADKNINTVGWPMAVMEAMASGTLVCFPNIRDDIKDYVGEFAYLYNEIEEVIDLIKQPIDEKKRKKMYDYAQQFDISRSIHLLTDLWAS